MHLFSSRDYNYPKIIYIYIYLHIYVYICICTVRYIKYTANCYGWFANLADQFCLSRVFTRVRASTRIYSIPTQKFWNVCGRYDMVTHGDLHWECNIQQNWSQLAAQHDFWFATSYSSYFSTENRHPQQHPKWCQLRIPSIQVQGQPTYPYQATVTEAFYRALGVTRVVYYVQGVGQKIPESWSL